ncbi:hypothetical protein JTE90_028051 [Oedothorax gibbosus]|uniref:Uncharacterized protein n=1 Tax=Oedothorax gibbosus TaxID=931172 RepID=A0AAV6UJ28_9ARAC|nr:hypothetical protein JTE90_028051 [Oedothorax gibbosus]
MFEDVASYVLTIDCWQTERQNATYEIATQQNCSQKFNITISHLYTSKGNSSHLKLHVLFSRARPYPAAR